MDSLQPYPRMAFLPSSPELLPALHMPLFLRAFIAQTPTAPLPRVLCLLVLQVQSPLASHRCLGRQCCHPSREELPHNPIHLPELPPRPFLPPALQHSQLSFLFQQGNVWEQQRDLLMYAASLHI